ncbi:Nin one binding Zn-ribbon like-domain-containing protein [Cladochytrium replicatum]|nr:Nin one binding Zn-ribbon like-domain-containing protein [Cladochytrium replicatum]
MELQQKIGKLVIDAGPIIVGATSNLHLVAKEYYTLPEIVDEIRDRQTRGQLARFPFEFKARVPSEEAMNAVIAFSKKTGDYSVLSANDLKLLALVYLLEKEARGIDHIRVDPLPPRTSDQAPPIEPPQRKKKKKNKKKKKSAEQNSEQSAQAVEPENVGNEEEDDEEEDGDVGEIVENVQDGNEEGVNDEEVDEDVEELVEGDEQEYFEAEAEDGLGYNRDVGVVPESNEGEDHLIEHTEADSAVPPDNLQFEQLSLELEEDDGEGEWITPKNVARKKARDLGMVDGNAKPTNKFTEVACMTTDFAIQNVLLQMNLSLVTVDGMRITRVKSWVLRCHGCFKVIHQMDKKFCPRCGGNTLTRVSIGVDAGGNVVLYLKKNFQYNLRGTKYSLPTPKGGRGHAEVVLREDQKEFQRAKAVRDRQRAKEMAGTGTATGWSSAAAEFLSSGNRVAADTKMTKTRTLRGETFDVGFGGAPVRMVVGLGRKNPNERRRNIR